MPPICAETGAISANQSAAQHAICEGRTILLPPELVWRRSKVPALRTIARDVGDETSGGFYLNRRKQKRAILGRPASGISFPYNEIRHSRKSMKYPLVENYIG